MGSLPEFLCFLSPATTAQHSTAQHGAAQHIIQPAQAAKQVRADQSATTPANRQSWLEVLARTTLWSSIYYTARCVFKTKWRNKKSLPVRPAEIDKPFIHKEASLVGAILPVHSWYTVSALLLSVLCTSSMRACRVRVVSVDHGALSWHLQVASLHLKNHRPLSLCPLHSSALCSILPCERA